MRTIATKINDFIFWLPLNREKKLILYVDRDRKFNDFIINPQNAKDGITDALAEKLHIGELYIYSK